MRPYIIVRQVRAKDVRPGDTFRHSFHTKDTWHVVESNETDCNGRHVKFRGDPWDRNIDDLELVDIQVEEPEPSIWPERWITSAREGYVEGYVPPVCDDILPSRP